MQFVFAPILGMLSDRIGRRPVLIVSLAGAAVDYLIMAFTPTLWVLVVGRIIAGITSANMSVAGAYIADITDEKDRAQRFSWMSAAFGVGFIIGPALGGLLSVYFLRAPFLVAAVLNGLNLVLALTVLKESRVPSRAPLDVKALNPFAPLKWALSFPALAPLMAMFLIFAINGDIPVPSRSFTGRRSSTSTASRSGCGSPCLAPRTRSCRRSLRDRSAGGWAIAGRWSSASWRICWPSLATALPPRAG